jgi:hypothetical protein
MAGMELPDYLKGKNPIKEDGTGEPPIVDAVEVKPEK